MLPPPPPPRPPFLRFCQSRSRGGGGGCGGSGGGLTFPAPSSLAPPPPFPPAADIDPSLSFRLVTTETRSSALAAGVAAMDGMRGAWGCPECGARYDDPTTRDNHVRSAHRATYPHWCSFCLCSYKHRDQLERHERWHRLKRQPDDPPAKDGKGGGAGGKAGGSTGGAGVGGT